MAFPERLLEESEEILIDRRPSWAAMLRPAVLVLVGVLVVWACLRWLPNGGIATVVKVVVLAQAAKVIVLTGGVQVLRWARTEYTLTSRRLVMRHGVWRRSVWEVPLTGIARCSVESGWIDRRLGTGTLLVETYGQQPGRTLRSFPRAAHARLSLSLAAESFSDPVG